MEFNDKNLKRTSKLINFLVASVLCIFLSSLATKVMYDLADWTTYPNVEDFKNQELIKKLRAKQYVLDSLIGDQRIAKQRIAKAVQVAQKNYTTEKKSFDNWLETRKALQSPTEDTEVRQRTQKLDKYYKVEQKWNKEVAIIDTKIATLDSTKLIINNQIYEEEQRAYTEYEEHLKAHETKIFAIRLLVILPLLGLGIFFLLRRRNHKYWSLFLGYILFSLYAFFFGLVPYFPDYGGYVRYIVGIILSIFLGIYFINRVRAFIEKRKRELQKSTQERSKQVAIEIAEKALTEHCCPSCRKDFIIRKWETDTPSKLKKKAPVHGTITKFCRFCGMELFQNCSNCGTLNFVHLPYCSECGTKTQADKDEN